MIIKLDFLYYQLNQCVLINLVRTCGLFPTADSYRKISKKNNCLNDYTNYLNYNDDINLMETMKCDYCRKQIHSLNHFLDMFVCNTCYHKLISHVFYPGKINA